MGERVAIIGSGVMGRNHARTLNSFGEVSLDYVIDADESRAGAVAREFGDDHTRTMTGIETLSAETVDAAIIASPSMYHEEQARALMEAGVHVLIEKPVAESPEAALELGALARKMGVVAMAGHIELFNPTVHSLTALLKDENIKEMSFDRLSTVPDASRLYHDVVSDLMIHDIAIAVRMLEQNGYDTNSELRAAIGRNETVASPDPARATIGFGHIDAHFRASRTYPAGKIRTAAIETDDKIFTADLLTRTIQATTASRIAYTPDGVLAEDTSTTSYFPRESQQPLALEQAHFFASMRGETTPEKAGVSLEQAAKVLKLTREVLNSIRRV